jgi:hypothetical protein
MSEMLQDVIDGTLIELRPRYIRKRLQAIRYGRGDHAAMRSPVREAAHVLVVVAGWGALVAGAALAVTVGW